MGRTSQEERPTKAGLPGHVARHAALGRKVGRYVLNEDELDWLDDLSLTSVIGDTADFLTQRDQDRGDDLPEVETDDSTVDELLEDDLIAPGL